MSSAVEVVDEPRREPGPAAPPGPYLLLADPAGARRRWPLTGPQVTLGRSRAVDVVVEGDLQVSRLHATFEPVGDGWTVRDDGLSRNGTYVNGQRISGRVRLRDRDSVRIGRTVLTFCSPGQVDEPRTVVGELLPGAGRLTPAQRAVLVALCRPCRPAAGVTIPATNAEIADELCLSVDAVKAHLRALFHRFDIDSLPQNAKRARLVELALQNGLVSRADI